MKHLFTMLFIFTLLTSSLQSHAATVQLPQTGQTLCYDTSDTLITCLGTGQDGELKNGVAWPSPRFADNGDQSITDNLTGLVWTKDAKLNPFVDSAGIPMNYTGATWQQALDYIKKLNTENYLGHNDWRLPNVNELASLVNNGQSDQSAWLNGQGFTSVQPGAYVSATSSATSYSTSSACYVSMNVGGVRNYSKGSSIYYVWPVRSGQSGAFDSLTLPKTGQTTCYSTTGSMITCAGTGQDGELQIGTAWPSPRFTDNSLSNSTEKTVTDNLTGLVWSKDANIAAGTKTWQQALDYVKTLNSINFSGHNDWRLPNVNELASLVNKGQSIPSTWLNGQGFTSVQPGAYWSSSNYVYNTGNAWRVNMNDVTVFGYEKANSYFVWPVRAGQSGPVGSYVLSVTKSGTGTGTVTSSTGSINCGSTCSASITSGTSVTLTATPSSGSSFTGWTGSCSGTGACTVTMDAAKSVTATFTLVPIIQTWTINSGNSSNGTVNCTTPVNNDATSTCTVTPATGYQLSTFTDNSLDKKSSVTGNSYSIVNVTADNNIAATFSQITSTIGTTTKSKVYMGAGGDIFTVGNSGTTVYGNTGIDTVTIADGVTSVTLDQNIEQINFTGIPDNYTFRQTGNLINVYDSTTGTLIVKAPVQGDTDGTVLGFNGGTASVLLNGGVMRLGGAIVSSGAAGVIEPTLK